MLKHLKKDYTLMTKCEVVQKLPKRRIRIYYNFAKHEEFRTSYLQKILS